MSELSAIIAGVSTFLLVMVTVGLICLYVFGEHD
jgi:hypothetical protein